MTELLATIGVLLVVLLAAGTWVHRAGSRTTTEDGR